MRHAILIVSKDKSLLESRALLLKSAGYLTLKASTITGSAGLASFCHLAIIDKTFTTEDHEDFIHRVHRDRRDLVVLSLRRGLIKPEVLIKAVTDCLTARPKDPKVVIIDDPATLPCHDQPS
jgi:hypothetical protein